MNAPSQISSHVQVRNLTFTSGNSNSIDLLNFRNVLFCVSYSAGASTLTMQASPDGTTWTTVQPGYYTSSTVTSPTSGTSANLTASATATAGQFLAVSLNRPLSTQRYFRVVATGTTTGGVALLGNPLLSAPTQPDFAVAETKGTY
jgi:hypothetical protein